MYGMSDKIGMVQVKDVEKSSPELQALIESEVKQLLKDSYERAKNILQVHSKEHSRLAEALLKYETLDLQEIKEVIQGKQLSRSLWRDFSLQKWQSRTAKIVFRRTYTVKLKWNHFKDAFKWWYFLIV